MSEIKYEAALAEIQSIVSKMENDELDVDQMSVQLKRAQELIKFCKEKSLLKNKFYAEIVVNLAQNVYFCMQN